MKTSALLAFAFGSLFAIGCVVTTGGKAPDSQPSASTPGHKHHKHGKKSTGTSSGQAATQTGGGETTIAPPIAQPATTATSTATATPTATSPVRAAPPTGGGMQPAIPKDTGKTEGTGREGNLKVPGPAMHEPAPATTSSGKLPVGGRPPVPRPPQ